ncbi:MAG: putative quinol monooxygenase [Culicoidibacterales bacterium]
MIYLTVLINVSKENEQEFLNGIQPLIAGSKQEEGCRAYFLTKMHNEQYNYVLHEVWESEEALEAHRQTAHYKTGVPQMSKITNVLLPMAGIRII